MQHHFGREAGAALVFAILYFLMWAYMTFMYATKRYQWKSRFTILYIHTIIRVASQACGVAFGVLVWDNVNVFIAYLILSAEGYFSLTIASYYFLKHYEIGHFGSSQLGPSGHEAESKEHRRKRIIAAFTYQPIFMPWKFWRHDLISLVDSWLIPANAIIVAGGSLMVGANDASNKLSDAEKKKRMDTSKGLRTAGQAIFLALTLLYVFLLCRLALRIKRRNPAPRYANAVLAAYSVVAAMLTARGIFGVLQAAIWSLSYYNPNNYTGTGFTTRFVTIEYCLAVVTEFVAASVLNASYWGSRHVSTNPEDLAETHELSKGASPGKAPASVTDSEPAKV